MGNIATKGCTSCVWQESQLSRILPNLPHECGYIVITRVQNGKGSLKSTKFKRAKIECALRLLEQTELDVWQVSIDRHRLEQWPNEGDICDLNKDLKIVQVEMDGNGDVQDVDIAPVENLHSDKPDTAQDDHNSVSLDDGKQQVIVFSVHFITSITTYFLRQYQLRHRHIQLQPCQ